VLLIAVTGWVVALLMMWRLRVAWGREASFRERLRDREGRLRLAYPTAHVICAKHGEDGGYGEFQEWTGQNTWPKVY
jgi:hypothetical protein